MKLNPKLWRLALRIEAAYRKRRSRRPSLELPQWAWRLATSAHQRFGICRSRGWGRAASSERQRLVSELDTLLAEIRSVRNQAATELPQLPKAADLYAELVAAADEFGDVSTENLEIYVSTEPISLEETYLGPFEIRLDLSQLHDPEPYRIVALDPHPSAADSDVTHPHVRSETACLGEAKAPLRAALEEGRIGDVFVLLDRLLHTYGAGSAYTELSHWDGTPCHDCGDVVKHDYLISCRSCDVDLCGDCSRSCTSCDNELCDDCAGCCAGCDDTTCPGCLRACRECDSQICRTCLTKGICDGCREEMEKAESEADESVVDADAPVHADGLGETAVPT